MIARLNGTSDASTLLGYLDRGGASLCAVLGAFCSAEQIASLPQKGIMHLAKIATFINSQGLDTRGFSKEYAAIAAACALTPLNVRIAYADLHHALGVKGNQFTTPIPGVSRAKLARFFKTGSAGTVTTRTSSSTGKNGLFGALGVTEKVDANGFVVTSRGAPLLIAYAQQLDKMTDGAFDFLHSK